MSAEYPPHEKEKLTQNPLRRQKIRHKKKSTPAPPKRPEKVTFAVPPPTIQSSSEEAPSSSDEYSQMSPDEEDINSLYEFHEKQSLIELSTITPSLKLTINSVLQNEIGLETTNAPWKQTNTNLLQKHFPQIEDLFGKKRLFLVSYPKSLPEKDDTFSVFDDVYKANRATELIKRLETFHRRKTRYNF